MERIPLHSIDGTLMGVDGTPVANLSLIADWPQLALIRPDQNHGVIRMNSHATTRRFNNNNSFKLIKT
jgi:hypothetical protein